ncbi:MAG: hypothetical protein M1602_03630 [Firmicutes bacterium]|nr:hypothetical protein [Bacillota bacterium]
MERSVTAIVFEGGQAEHPLAGPMLSVRSAVTLDTLDKLRQLQEVAKVVVCSDRPEVLAGAQAMGLVIEQQPAEPFHFGRWLQDIVRRHARDAVLYLGGASAPLMTRADFAAAAGLLGWGGPRVVANNPQSPDLIGFYPADLLESLEPPASDNALGLALRDLPVEMLLVPVSCRASFDLDTPADLLIYREILRASRSGAGFSRPAEAGPGTLRAIEALEWNQPAWEAALRRVRQPFADMAIIGRVGAPLVAHLNQTYTLRLRVFSEERGMKALGREARGEVRTLLGAYLEDVGPARFFQRMAEVAGVAFIDTRPLLAHGGRRVSEADRFASDLGLVDSIRDPWVAEFTAAAFDAALPVVLGGHSLVSGGLWALLDYAVRPVAAKA